MREPTLEARLKALTLGLALAFALRAPAEAHQTEAQSAPTGGQQRQQQPGAPVALALHSVQVDLKQTNHSEEAQVGAQTLPQTANKSNEHAPQEKPPSADSMNLPLYTRILATIACVLIFTVGVSGNLLVPLVVIKTKYLRNSTNLFLINLSIADLLVLIVCMPTVLIELHSRPETWLLGEPMCKVSNFVEMFAANGSIFTILAISFERYYAICKPLKAGYKCTRLRATIIICFIWLLSSVSTSPILSMAKSSETIYIDGSLVYNCILETDGYWPKMYVFVSMFAFFCLPLIVLMIVYWLISRRLIRENLAMSGASSQLAPLQRDQRQSEATIKGQVSAGATMSEGCPSSDINISCSPAESASRAPQEAAFFGSLARRLSRHLRQRERSSNKPSLGAALATNEPEGSTKSYTFALELEQEQEKPKLNFNELDKDCGAALAAKQRLANGRRRKTVKALSLDQQHLMINGAKANQANRLLARRVNLDQSRRRLEKRAAGGSVSASRQFSGGGCGGSARVLHLASQDEWLQPQQSPLEACFEENCPNQGQTRAAGNILARIARQLFRTRADARRRQTFEEGQMQATCGSPSEQAFIGGRGDACGPPRGAARRGGAFVCEQYSDGSLLTNEPSTDESQAPFLPTPRVPVNSTGLSTFTVCRRAAANEEECAACLASGKSWRRKRKFLEGKRRRNAAHANNRSPTRTKGTKKLHWPKRFSLSALSSTSTQTNTTTLHSDSSASQQEAAAAAPQGGATGALLPVSQAPIIIQCTKTLCDEPAALCEPPASHLNSSSSPQATKACQESKRKSAHFNVICAQEERAPPGSNHQTTTTTNSSITPSDILSASNTSTSPYSSSTNSNSNSNSNSSASSNSSVSDSKSPTPDSMLLSGSERAFRILKPAKAAQIKLDARGSPTAINAHCMVQEDNLTTLVKVVELTEDSSKSNSINECQAFASPNSTVILTNFCDKQAKSSINQISKSNINQDNNNNCRANENLKLNSPVNVEAGEEDKIDQKISENATQAQATCGRRFKSLGHSLDFHHGYSQHRHQKSLYASSDEQSHQHHHFHLNLRRFSKKADHKQLAACTHLHDNNAKTQLTEVLVVQDSSKKQQMESRRQVVKMLAFVVLCFFILFCPYRVFTIWLILSTEAQVQSLGMETYYNLTYFCRILIYLHSAINPIAYNLISTKFRRAFISILLCRGQASRRQFTTEHRIISNRPTTISHSERSARQSKR